MIISMSVGWGSDKQKWTSSRKTWPTAFIIQFVSREMTSKEASFVRLPVITIITRARRTDRSNDASRCSNDLPLGGNVMSLSTFIRTTDTAERLTEKSYYSISNPVSNAAGVGRVSIISLILLPAV